MSDRAGELRHISARNLGDLSHRIDEERVQTTRTARVRPRRA